MNMNMYSQAGSSNVELAMTGVAGASYGVYTVGYLYGYSNVAVDGTGTLLKDSSFAGYWDNNHNWVTTPDTSVNTNNANENRPENFTIKIWKRTA